MTYNVGDRVRAIREISCHNNNQGISAGTDITIDGVESYVGYEWFSSTSNICFNSEDVELVSPEPEERSDSVSEIEQLRSDVLRIAREEGERRGWCDELEEVLRRVPGLIVKKKQREVILRFDADDLQHGGLVAPWLGNKLTGWGLVDVLMALVGLMGLALWGVAIWMIVRIVGQ